MNVINGKPSGAIFQSNQRLLDVGVVRVPPMPSPLHRHRSSMGSAAPTYRSHLDSPFFGLKYSLGEWVQVGYEKTSAGIVTTVKGNAD